MSDPSLPHPASAHVIVVGNEKGGSGKSTVAVHLTVALLNAGQRVATIDLDSRQKSFTHYIENRQAWSRRHDLELALPNHHCIARADGLRVDDNEDTECADFAAAVHAVEGSHDFLVIDTPGYDAFLMRLAHSMADTLITPLNDSFIDFDVLGTLDPDSGALKGTSHYADMVADARRQRRTVDNATMDWIVVRNRLATLNSHNKRLVGERLHDLSLRLGFRTIDGFAERVVFRELFPRGLTALDASETATPGALPTSAHLAARAEVNALISALRLPFDLKSESRAAARGAYELAATMPLELDDILQAS